MGCMWPINKSDWMIRTVGGGVHEFRVGEKILKVGIEGLQ